MNLPLQELIPEKNISLTISESTGTIIIDTTKMNSGNRTFSNIKIYRPKNRNRVLVSAEYSFIYSAAQLLEAIKKNQQKYSSLTELCDNMNIRKSDYRILTNISNQTGEVAESIRFRRQKIILNKVYSLSFDCPDYLIIR